MSQAPKETKGVRLSLLDLVTIIYHVHRGSQLPELVGFEDAERSLQELTKELSVQRARVPQAVLESALWSCNLMDENKLWWSPTNESLESFLARVFQYAPGEVKLEFDRRYNLLRRSSHRFNDRTSQTETASDPHEFE